MTDPELLVKLDPLDLLAVTPVEPEVLEADPEAEEDELDVEVSADSEMSLWAQTPSTRSVLVPGTWSATVR
ncbi:MAG: hypothetical protein U0P48_14655, partial [Ancrocorticia sp.]